MTPSSETQTSQAGRTRCPSRKLGRTSVSSVPAAETTRLPFGHRYPRNNPHDLDSVFLTGFGSLLKLDRRNLKAGLGVSTTKPAPPSSSPIR